MLDGRSSLRLVLALAIGASACVGKDGDGPTLGRTAQRLSLAPGRFTTFESGPTRPRALSPNGRLLFSVNTPDARLEIFRVERNGLVHLSSVAVGIEPVAVAARSDEEVWVVNHLS